MAANDGYFRGAEKYTWKALRVHINSIKNDYERAKLELEYWRNEDGSEIRRCAAELVEECAQLEAQRKVDADELKAKLELSELLLEEEKKARLEEVAKLKEDLETAANESTMLHLVLKRQEAVKPKEDIDALVKKAKEDAEAGFREKLEQLEKEVEFWRDRAEHPEPTQVLSDSRGISKVGCLVRRKTLAKKTCFYDTEPEDSDTENEEVVELGSSPKATVSNKEEMTPKTFSRVQREGFSAALQNLNNLNQFAPDQQRFHDL